eukprot:CAMPEP_0196654830 /NCGR_PEP_ID=MMETSP1086-20130531/4561_1 /TAXON_ID=77921 /ORGANISM="Cyanoptyche  gloeocystis , Strain SAG4.97" /LENGTH=258 /DNA_ID=CAMNT_0041986811 /DNA_START=67 /DNA_END=843 /DNA_ORIENTATION=-
MTTVSNSETFADPSGVPANEDPELQVGPSRKRESCSNLSGERDNLEGGLERPAKRQLANIPASTCPEFQEEMCPTFAERDSVNIRYERLEGRMRVLERVLKAAIFNLQIEKDRVNRLVQSSQNSQIADERSSPKTAASVTQTEAASSSVTVGKASTAGMLAEEVKRLSNENQRLMEVIRLEEERITAQALTESSLRKDVALMRAEIEMLKKELQEERSRRDEADRSSPHSAVDDKRIQKILTSTFPIAASPRAVSIYH